MASTGRDKSPCLILPCGVVWGSARRHPTTLEFLRVFLHSKVFCIPFSYDENNNSYTSKVLNVPGSILDYVCIYMCVCASIFVCISVHLMLINNPIGSVVIPS